MQIEQPGRFFVFKINLPMSCPGSEDGGLSMATYTRFSHVFRRTNDADGRLSAADQILTYVTDGYFRESANVSRNAGRGRVRKGKVFLLVQQRLPSIVFTHCSNHVAQSVRESVFLSSGLFIIASKVANTTNEYRAACGPYRLWGYIQKNVLSAVTSC